MSRFKTILAVSALGAASAIISFSAVASATGNNIHRGRVPEPAFASGHLDLTLVPDLVQVLGPDGNAAGYVRRDDLYPTTADGEILERKPAIPVVDANDIRIGDWLQDRGFVAMNDATGSGGNTPGTTAREN